MRRPVEHGNIFSSIILGGSSIVLAILTRGYFISILYWVPIWMGLFLYDVPFKRLWKSQIDTAWMIILVAASIASIYIDYLLIVPYAIFFLTYVLRIFLASRKLSYLGTVSGILGFVILFVETIGLTANREILLMGSLFVYMIGSEFTVRAKLSSARYLLLYDLVPVVLVILNPVFLVFSVSVARIPIALKTEGLRPVGMTETVLLLSVTILISLFYVLRV
ncbi:MAG: hypothetical protein LVQ63_04380 [Thermoplasmatales archaeon]|nr:hypothetical protein [Thermoplasmatales archaeon]